MKVIFLDIDGVMNGIEAKGQHPDARRGLVSFLDPGPVELLNRIIAATGAVVVVSSTWRLGIPWNDLVEAFREAGCTATIIGGTPDIDARDRQLEVMTWLASQKVQPERFVVIDDYFRMDALPGALVRTDKYTGLSERDVAAVLARLAD